MQLYRLTAVLFFTVLLTAACDSFQRNTPAQQAASTDTATATPSDTLNTLPDDTAEVQSAPPQTQARTKGNQPSSHNDIRQSRHNAITRAVDRVSPAVVSITVTEVVQSERRLAYDQFFGFFMAPGREREFQSMGSGFIISPDGKLVTNEHVAGKNAKKIMVSMSDGQTYEAEVLGSDEFADLSLLQITADTTFPYIEFGDSDDVIVGEWSIAIGNAFGLFSQGKPTVTVGVISATSRDFHPNPNEPRVYQDMIQTDAAINRGNSGGPLVNSKGEVIGVNTFIFTGGTSNGFVGLGFAIPSNRVQKIIGQLETSGTVQLGYDPGFEITPISRKLAYEYNLPTAVGMLVVSVNKDGPAYEAGIMPGDIILRIGEERVTSKMHAWALFREYHVGEKMRLEILRKGRRYETHMKLRKKVPAGQK